MGWGHRILCERSERIPPLEEYITVERHTIRLHYNLRLPSRYTLVNQKTMKKLALQVTTQVP